MLLNGLVLPPCLLPSQFPFKFIETLHCVLLKGCSPDCYALTNVLIVGYVKSFLFCTSKTTLKLILNRSRGGLLCMQIGAAVFPRCHKHSQ